MTSRLLLDTCAAIWLVEGAPLADTARAAINAAYARGDAVLVSPITAWEIGLLISRGRVTAPITPSAWFRQLVSMEGIALATLPIEALIGSSFLPATPPRDPADRMIIATAREAGLAIVTRDRLILDYAAAGHVLAIPC